MAQSRFKFFENAWNSTLVHWQKGFPTQNMQELFSADDDISYGVPMEYRYRPDLIANKFYRNPKLSWVLIYANGFYNSPEDFDVGAIIRIPKFERIMGLL